MINYIGKADLNKRRGETALLRADLNVDSRENSFRLKAVLPDIRLLLCNKIRIVILSHHGRPARYDENLSLRPFAAVLSKELKKKVGFLRDLSIPKSGNIFLVENLRFWKGEEKNDALFAKKLSRLGDFYINDAFAVSHRKNASVHAITRFLPSYGGLLLQKEIENLSGVMKKARRPFTVVIGGAKIADKLGVLEYFWSGKKHEADAFLIAGGPANTFFAAKGLPMGDSIWDKAMVPKIKKYAVSPRLVLPLDVKVAGKKILDIGPQTVEKYAGIISKSKTVIWNGPPGLFEKKGFEHGTVGIWRAILRLSEKSKKATVIIGGGETTASLKLLKKPRIPSNVFLSTGGGAMLEYLSGKKLPGVEALK